MADTITLSDGRRVGFAEFGAVAGTPVIWSHGGPGSRLEPQAVEEAALTAGFRLIGIDRPGYGGSDPQPGRRIGDWPADALAVADHLDLDTFYAVGVSTGGAYALALAAASRRVKGVVACCALTDMRWREGRAGLLPGMLAIWDAASRDAAARLAEDQFGAEGSRMATLTPPGFFPAADVATLTDAAAVARAAKTSAVTFAQGVTGYVDDRLADGVGWGSFDVGAVSCPVIVLHGEDDPLVPLAHASHTAEIVSGARLVTQADHGHISIIGEVIAALETLRRAA